MAKDKNFKNETKTPDTTRPRNEETPGQLSVGTSTTENLDEKNSPDVRDALNESQL